MPKARFIRTSATIVASLLVVGLEPSMSGTPERRQVLQPIHEYTHLKEAVTVSASGAPVLNGFLNYTHLGTDFGFLGPAPLQVGAENGAVCANFGEDPAAWGGMWHSLNALARENTPLDLRAPYPALIRPEFQPRVVGVQAVAGGIGKLKVEMKGRNVASQGQPPTAAQWSQLFELSGTGKSETFSAAVNGETIPYAQTLNWVAEPGSRLFVDSIALNLELPDVDFPTYVLLSSYAKLARCYSPETGLVRDRAHVGPESLNNVAATGMFTLATVAAQRAGMVEEAAARDVVRRVAKTLQGLPKKNGLLPHFVAQVEGNWVALPGAEYSTIDTALALFSLRIAANALGEEEVANQALEMLKGIEMHKLRDSQGYVLHGVHPDGTPIPFVWRDWGGETALVLMMQRVAGGSSLAPLMDESGRSHRGIGFITEIGGLFFPQFNTNAKARAGSVDWRAYRQLRLAEQKRYFTSTAPQSLAAQLGLYGLSAGEGPKGIGYHTAGTEDSEQRLIYPHYILMSGLMEPNTQPVYDVLRTLESRGWLTPWGLVENIDADGKSYVPMISALNGAFESLAAYHLLVAHRGEHDELYAAAAEDTVFQDAMQAVFE